MNTDKNIAIFFYTLLILFCFLASRAFPSTDESIKEKDLPFAFLDGKIDFIQREFQLNLHPQEGSVFIEGRFPQDSSFYLHAKLDHLNIKGIDLCSDIRAEGEFSKDTTGKLNSIKGTLRTSDSIINFQPFKELEASYEIVGTLLKIVSCKLGEEFQLSGTIELIEPHRLDLTLDIVGADTSSIATLTGIKGELLSGLINGKLEIQGPIASPYLRGYLEAMEGRLGDIKYQSAKVNLNGYNWLAEIYDSRVNRENGFLTLEGEVDLKKFGRPDVLEGLRLKSDQRTIVWDGWDIIREEERDEVSLKKGVGEDFQVNFKSFLNEGLEENTEQEEGEVGLEYKLKGNKALRMRMRRYEDFLSLEQRVRF